ncbi:MAG: MraY family glycosyltransferase [Alphaproteobacteria bacterium]
MFDWISPLLALLTVLILIPPACVLALKAGYVDEPGGRKQHAVPVPPVGGIIIFPVFIVASLFAGFDDALHLYFYIALAMIVSIGAIDDRIHVPAWIKFFIQIAAAGLLVWAGPGHIDQLDNIFGLGDLGLSYMSVPFSMAAIVLLINAMNLMDGLDGLAAGMGVIIVFWLIVAATAAGEPQAAQSVAILAAVLTGFLFYNMRNPWRRRAVVFLGDAGSLGLGLCIACFCIDLAQEPAAVLKPISVAWILALPIIDVCAQFYRRVREGRHPFDPDRGHFHHHPIHAGFSVRQTVGLIFMLMLIFGAIGVLGYRFGVPQWLLTTGWIVLLFAHMHYARVPQHYINLFTPFTKPDPVDN